MKTIAHQMIAGILTRMCRNFLVINFLDYVCKTSIRHPTTNIEYPASSIKCCNQNGIALVTVLMVSLLLAIMGSAALMVAHIEIKISGNYKTGIEGGECANAGIAVAARNLVNKTITGDGTADWSFTENMVGYNNTYTVSYVVVEDNNGNKQRIFDENSGVCYQIDSTGALLNSWGAAIKKRAIIKLKRTPLFQFSIFGNSLVEYKNSGMVDSYDSRSGGYDPALARKNSSLGSNGDIILKNDSIVNGNIGVGEDSRGVSGSLTSVDTTITGRVDSMGRIDPNPLGERLDAYIDEALTDNNNFDLNTTYINGDDLMMPQGGVLNLGPGRYYFTDIVLDSGSVLNIDGAVKIFLNGGLHMGNNATIMTASGKPADLMIFSNSTEEIILNSTADFFGCIYAPYAKVVLKNSRDVYGALWADELINQDGAALHYDEALGDRFFTGDYIGFELVSLRDL